MIAMLLAGALSFAAPEPVSLPALPTAVQDDEEKPDKRPEIADLLAQLKEHVKARGKEDDQAISVLDSLTQEFPKSGPKDQKDIAKGVSNVFKEKRKDLDDGSPDNKLFQAAAVALGTMGELGAPTLDKLTDDKHFRDDLDLERRIVLALGKTQSEKHVKTLLDLLKHHEPRMQAYAAEALANFAEHDLDLRKKIFEEILKVMMGVRAKVDTDPNELIEHARWDVIGGPMITTLQKLTGHDERDPQAWQQWWNHNKKGDWDEGKG